MKKIKYFSIGLFTFGLLLSCSKDSLEPTLDNSITTQSIKTYDDLLSVANGMYKAMRTTEYYGRDFIIFDEVRSDNTFSSGKSGRFTTVGAMDLTDSDAYAGDTFSAIYRPISNANIIINTNVSGGDEASINHVKGEAYAVRALCHFDLLKLYGQQFVEGQGGLNAPGIAYITAYKSGNVYPSRSTVGEVKQKIYDDLDAAISNMSESLNDTEKITMTTYAAHALKSRIALYFKDWEIAKNEAEYVISNGGFEIADETNYVDSFTVNSSVGNKIFTLKELSNDNNGIDGLANIYRGNSYGDINVLQNLKNIFESTDVRGLPTMIKTVSGKLRNVGKYPTGSPNYNDNIIVLRYEEVILNYAEALFRINPDDPQALIQLNSIAIKRLAKPYTSINEDNILLERRKELCFEGFRFSDLARTGKDIPLVSPTQQTHGGVSYGSYKYAFPIPLKELNSNPNTKQNQGY